MQTAQSSKPPFSSQLLLRISCIIIVILAITAGYYSDVARNYQEKYTNTQKQLENISKSTVIEKK
jgi:hypothetical protein